MGMYDESWCSSCGCSQPYSEDEVVCGNCTSEAYDIRSGQLINYIKLHVISLVQDREKTTEPAMYEYYDGAVEATEHLLSVAADILGVDLIEEK